MKNLYVNICKRTRMVNLPKQFIAVDGENLQSRLIFEFEDEFVDGIARLEYELDGQKNYILLEKEVENYFVDIKNILTKNGQINMQLVITENSVDDEIPVFKSNIFYLYCNASINAVEEAPQGYELWIETANAKLNEVENVDIDMIDTTITITRRDGTQKSVLVEGKPGATPNIQVGDTKTLAPTQMALVTRMGTDENPIFEFSIPRGKDGRDGKDGGVSADEVREIIDSSLDNIETGVSLKEVQTITGELENLSTTDKENLVNAINEVFTLASTGESGGGGETRIFTEITTTSFNLSSWSGTTFTEQPSGFYRNATSSTITCKIYSASNSSYNTNVYIPSNGILLWNNRTAFLFDYKTALSGGTYGKSIMIASVSGSTTYKRELSILSEAETISGLKTFSKLPESSVVPTSDTQLVNKKYVDDAIAALRAELIS